MQRVWKEKEYHVHTDHKRVRVAKLIVNKIDFKTKAITRYKEGYFIMIKEPISQENGNSSKLIYRFKIIPIKIPVGIFAVDKLILKFTWKTIKKEEPNSTHISQFQTYKKSLLIKTVCHSH